MSSMIRTAATLHAQFYRSLCSRCLAEALGTSVNDADDVARVLSGHRFIREWHVCARCREDDIVLTHVPSCPLGGPAV
jgi:hypothetical protein